MAYQCCRWYDAYPKLTFALKLVQLMPVHQQQLAVCALHDLVIVHQLDPEDTFSGDTSYENRWYDTIGPLAESLAVLQSLSPVLQEKYTERWWNILQSDLMHPMIA